MFIHGHDSIQLEGVNTKKLILCDSRMPNRSSAFGYKLADKVILIKYLLKALLHCLC